jgi:hypothetical protein
MNSNLENTENTVNKRVVICMKCGHTWTSGAAKPQCSNCNSTVVCNVNDVPRVYGGKALRKLKEEFKEYKESRDRILTKLLDRIKALEAKEAKE